jgi:hypothetical protein
MLRQLQHSRLLLLPQVLPSQQQPSLQEMMWQQRRTQPQMQKQVQETISLQLPPTNAANVTTSP